MFNHLQSLSLSYYSKTPVGWIMARVNSDSDRVADLVTWGLLDATWGITNILTSMAFMFYINWRLALIVLAALPILLYVAIQFRKRILPSSAWYVRSTRRSPARTTKTSPACAW
jgi:ATP-binding cassette, subfamily B, bacterial